MKLYPIVEGHGEVEAVPVLLRRLIHEAQCFDIEVGPPIRRTQPQLRSAHGVQAAVELAFLNADCGAVLVLFDEEDDCPVTRAAEVRAWAHAAAHGKPCDVVVAHREYETWFLAALESLRGRRGISTQAEAPDVPESKRDAKGALEAWMPANRAYAETSDQAALSAVFDLGSAHRRSRSFRKLVSTVGKLLENLGCRHEPWPPQSWDTQGRSTA